ncbi:MAG: AraC family transcriptional regulator [Clostridia bacterium]|nr:AraC family transcriptional regulator [Clostridia bacterium]
MKAVYLFDSKQTQCRLRRSLEFKMHFHHQVEVVYMLKGECTAIVEGEEFLLRSGDILTVFPNQIHEYKDGKNEEFFIAIFRPETLPDYRDLFYNMVPVNKVYSTENKNELLLYLARKMPEMYEKENRYKEAIYKGFLTAFFGELFSFYELKKAKSADMSVLKSVLLFCNENYLNNICLEDASESLHVSKFYISHLLNKKLGISFNDYVNSLRITDAVYLLEKKDGGMTEIAQKCGFNTVRTFNRAFKSVYGVSPSKYKRENIDINNE